MDAFADWTGIAMLTISITRHGDGDAHALAHACCDPSYRAIDALLADTSLGCHGAIVNEMVLDDAEVPDSLMCLGKRPSDEQSPESTDEQPLKKPCRQKTESPVQTSLGADIDGEKKAVDLKEEARLRQRGYERKYRLKTRLQYREIRDEWLEKEMELYDLICRRALNKAEYTRARCVTTKEKLAWLIKEERVLRLDRILLRNSSFWFSILQQRALENAGLDEKSLPPRVTSRQEWAVLDRFYLGPSVIKPFRPLKFRFNL